MERLTQMTESGAYRTRAKKDELVKALARYEDEAEERAADGTCPGTVGALLRGCLVQDDWTVKVYKGAHLVAKGEWFRDDILKWADYPVLTANWIAGDRTVIITIRQREGD